MADEERIIQLFADCDPRIGSLRKEIENLLWERAGGRWPVATVVGLLEIIKHDIISNSDKA